MAQMQKFGIKLDPTRGSDEFTQSEFYSRPELWDREGMRDWSINSDDATSLLRQVQKHNWSEAARDSPNLLDLPRELLDPNLTVDAALPWLGLQKSGDNYTFAGPSKTPHFPGEGGFGNFLKVAAPFMLGGGALLGGFGGAAGVAGGAAGGAPVSQIPLFGQAPLAGVPVSSNAAWMAPGAAGGASDLAKLASGASSLFSDGSENFEAGSLEAASNMGGGGGIGSVLSSIFGGGGGAAGGAGGLLSLLSKGLDIGTGLYGIKQAGDLKDFASETSRSMDPFGPYRTGYAEQLKRLSENPSTITQTPGWDAGIQAVQRSAAGRGYLNSGNEISALQNFGGNFFNNESARLSRLAGADINPGAAGQLAMQGNMSSTNLLGQALNRISAGIGGLF